MLRIEFTRYVLKTAVTYQTRIQHISIPTEFAPIDFLRGAVTQAPFVLRINLDSYVFTLDHAP